jgi:hypothetical protein
MSAESSEFSPLCHGPTITEWKTAHELLKDNALWPSLAFDGIQHDGRGGLLEYRRCPRCTSTIGCPIALAKPLEVCSHQASLQERSQEAIELAHRIQRSAHAI